MDKRGDGAVGVEGKILGLINLTVGAAVFRFMLEVDTELAGAPSTFWTLLEVGLPSIFIMTLPLWAPNLRRSIRN